MSFLTILPLAIVMVAGPQIISPIFLALGDNYRRVSRAYLAGVALAITLGVTVVYLVAKQLKVSAGSSEQATWVTVADWVIAVLLLYLMVRIFRTRGRRTEAPKWMGKLQTASPKFSFRLGFLLFIAMPTDVITMLTVGITLARDNSPWWQCVPFLLLTMLFAALPLLTVLLLGKRAQEILPEIRDWMNGNSWLVSEFVLGFFLAMMIL